MNLFILIIAHLSLVGYTTEEPIIKWDDYLKNMYDLLKDPRQILSKITKFNVQNLDDWDKGTDKSQGFPEINRQNYAKFFDNLIKTAPHLSQYGCFTNISSKQFDQINDIIKLTLKSSVLDLCDNGRLILKGNIVRTSMIKDQLKIKCFEELDPENKKPRLIEILATEAIIIDGDIELNGEYAMLVLVTPHTYAFKKYLEIQLDGEEAKELENQGERPNGTHGRPGYPGGTAGSFLKISFLDTKWFHHYVYVYARGQYGSAGENGWPGKWGTDGADASEEKYDKSKKEPRKFLCRHHYPGILGDKGHPGGNGGVVGRTGLSGNMSTFMSNDWTKFIRLETKIPGRMATCGRGGKGGKGGDRGRTFVPPLTPFGKFYWEPAVDPKEAPRGDTGKSCNNTKGIREPFPQIKPDLYRTVAIMDYMFFLYDSCQQEALRPDCYKRILYLLTNADYLSACNSTCLVDLYVGLENRFHLLHDQINCTHLYVTYLQIVEAKINTITKKTSLDEIKVFKHMYTAIRSKLFSLRDHIEEKFIANLNDFLNMFIEKLNKYKTIKGEVNVREANKVYKKKLDEQAEDAKSIVSGHLIPQLEVLRYKIEDAMYALHNEIELMKKKELDNYAKLTEARAEMKKNFFWKMFSDTLSMIGNVLGGVTCVVTLGNVGAAKAVAAPAKALAGFGSMFIGKDPEIPQVKDLTGILNKKITDITNARANARRVLSESSQGLSFYMRQYQFLDVDIARLQAKFDEGMKKIDDDRRQDPGSKWDIVKGIVGAAKGAAKGVMDFFGATKSQMSGLNIDAGKFGSKFGKFSGKLDQLQNKLEGVTYLIDNVVECIETGINTFSEIKRHQANMAETKKSQNTALNNVEALGKYQEAIEKQMAPMLDNMIDDLKGVSKQMDGKTTTQVEKKQVQIENYLKTVIWAVEDFTKGFESGNLFKEVIESIKSVVQQMFNVFKKVAEMGEKKDMADLLMQTNLPAMSANNIQNPMMKDSINKLLMTIEANIILTDYKIWLKQIKLFVFPLANTFIQSFNIPSVLKPKELTLDGYIYSAVEEVERFRMRYIESSVYVGKYDRIKHRGLFYSYTQNGPFFEWKSSKYNGSIAQLLAGQKATFEALVVSHKLNAMKFRRIDLYFKAHDPSKQKMLDEILQHFVVRMKHTGNNYYNCDGKTYVASVTGQEFQFSYQHLNNQPVDYNLVYDKIVHGDYMLSPYTTWQIQLVKKNIPNYHSLTRNFSLKVDLELTGEGEYYENDPIVCQEDLSQYFEMQDQEDKTERNVVKPITCPPKVVIPKKFCVCEMNPKYDSRRWCRGIVRKMDGKLNNVFVSLKEDDKYFYYDMHFPLESLSAADKAKFVRICNLEGSDKICRDSLNTLSRYPPWRYQEDLKGVDGSYVMCVKGNCIGRIRQNKPELSNVKPNYRDKRFHYYTKFFPKTKINRNEESRFKYCNITDESCASAFINLDKVAIKFANPYTV